MYIFNFLHLYEQMYITAIYCTLSLMNCYWLKKQNKQFAVSGFVLLCFEGGGIQSIHQVIVH